MQSEGIGGAAHAASTTIESPRAVKDLGRFHVRVAEQFLNGTEIVPVFKPVRGERVRKVWQQVDAGRPAVFTTSLPAPLMIASPERLNKQVRFNG